MKATYSEANGEGHELFKDPITDDGMKKSAKGLLCVLKDASDNYILKDQCTKEEEQTGELTVVYNEGTFTSPISFGKVRENINSTF